MICARKLWVKKEKGRIHTAHELLFELALVEVWHGVSRQEAVQVLDRVLSPGSFLLLRCRLITPSSRRRGCGLHVSLSVEGKLTGMADMNTPSDTSSPSHSGSASISTSSKNSAPSVSSAISTGGSFGGFGFAE